MSRSKRILFLLLINLGLVILSIYFLDMLEILDYRQIFSQIPFLRESFVVKIENPFLLEKLELDKKWLLLEEKQRNLDDAKREMEKAFLMITQKQEELAQEKENIQNMIAQFELAKQILKGELFDAGFFVFYDEDKNFRFSFVHSIYKGTKREFS
ncbi:MAG: hypothetical protein ACK4TN_03530, partial [Brevinematales bacterium]